MPPLRELTCQIEWPETGLKFEEYGTVYGDGVVESYIAVPDKPQPFSVHLWSKSYIAEGLALLVYIDGEYQCNRNRLNLRSPRKGQSKDQTVVDFRLRQKEKTLGDGTFIGREWRFDCHNIVPSGELPNDLDPTHFDQLGVIEIIVLRCRAKGAVDEATGSFTHDTILGEIDAIGQHQDVEDAIITTEDVRNYQPKATEVPEGDAGAFMGMGGLFDGAADQPHHFGLDGEPPPGGVWTWSYVPRTSPAYQAPQHNQNSAPRQEKRVHFDINPSQQPSYPTKPPSYSQNSQTTRGPANTKFGSPDWQGRAPPRPSGSYEDAQWGPTYQSGGYNGAHPGSEYASRGYDSARQAPEYPSGDYRAAPPESGYRHFPGPNANGADYSSHNLHGPPRPNEYRAFEDPRAYLGPPRMPPHPSWMTAEYGYPARPLPSHPVWMPHYQSGTDQNYPTMSGMLPPSYPPHNHCPGPGCNMARPMPTAHRQQDQGDHPGGMDPARDGNNQNSNLTNEGNNITWGQDINNVNQDNGDNSGGGWEQQGGGDGGDNNNTKQDDWPNQGDQAQTNPGGNDWATGGQQDGNNTNNGSGWETTNNETQNNGSNWDQNSNEAPNNETSNNGDNGGNANDNQVDQNNLPNQTWDTNGGNNNQQNTNNWDTNVGQAQPLTDNWNTGPQQTSNPAAQFSARTARPLYGPYGAYYTHNALDPSAEVEEEPPYDVPEPFARTTHQVQPGKGYLYLHQRASPEYIDTIEEPYARFVFKYRTKEQVEAEIGITIDCEPTGDEEKRKFVDKTQDELIELLIRAKSALGGTLPSPPPPRAPEERTKENTLIPAPVPAPKSYEYLKYALPQPRKSAGLGILNANTGTADTNTAQNQDAGGGWGGAAPSVPMNTWGKPPAVQNLATTNEPEWQTAAQNGAGNQGQFAGGNAGTWEAGNNVQTNQSSPTTPPGGAGTGGGAGFSGDASGNTGGGGAATPAGYRW